MAMTEPQILQTLMKWRSRVSAAAWIVVRDAHAAEDIFQNVALKALTKDVTFDNDASLLSWAFITARREGLDWLHRHRREVVSLHAELLEILEREWQSHSHTSDESRLGALETCLEATPEDSRRLLKLRYFEGLACQEVATKLGISLDTIYKRLSRLHESLRQCIDGKLATAKQPGVAAQ
jgi:RNA polymerase sigma-70 factor, ECF subfamily